MAAAKMPVVYSLESRNDGMVQRLVIVTAAGKFQEYDILSDKNRTETDYNPENANIFDDPKTGVGYISVPSQVSDQYKLSIVEGATDDYLETMKTRFNMAKSRMSESE